MKSLKTDISIVRSQKQSPKYNYPPLYTFYQTAAELARGRKCCYLAVTHTTHPYTHAHTLRARYHRSWVTLRAQAKALQTSKHKIH